MKKYVVLILLIMCMPLLVMSEQKEKQKPAKPVLRVGSECDYIPNSWEEIEASEYNIPVSNHAGYYAEGYDIQIARRVAAHMNYDLKVVKVAWNDLLPSLNNGDIDAIFSSMLDTDERRKVAAFSDPYEARPTEYAVIVAKGSPYITAKSLKDFRGARIIGERGTKLDDVIEQIHGAVHLEPARSVRGIIDAVCEGIADGGVIDVDTGTYYELMNNNLMLIKFSDDNGFQLGFNGVCAGVRKADTELLHRINLAIFGIDRGERQKIMDSVNSRMLTHMR